MGGLIKKAAPAAGFALGGPAGAGLASFGAASLTGDNFIDSLMNGATAGAMGGASAPAAGGGSSLGGDFLSGLGFGKDPWKNAMVGGQLGLQGLNSLPKATLPTLEFLPAQPSLLETLSSRRAY